LRKYVSNGSRQRRFAVVNVTNRADIYVRLGALEMSLLPLVKDF
jgi:hypothetical protein